MLCVRRWSEAGPAGRVRCWQVQCRDPKTEQQKGQSTLLRRRSTVPFYMYIIYQWSGPIAVQYKSYVFRHALTPSSSTLAIWQGSRAVAPRAAVKFCGPAWPVGRRGRTVGSRPGSRGLGEGLSSCWSFPVSPPFTQTEALQLRQQL